MRDLHHLNRYRQGSAEIEFYGRIGDAGNGIFAIPMGPVRLKVIASSGYGWDHVSVSPWHKKRCPTWDEMSAVKRMFFHDHEVVMELHVAQTDHISFHDYTLHLWRPQRAEIPLPPSVLVGPRADQTKEDFEKQLDELRGL